ncbi:MAG: GNAT family N-acetyltransferase, partial [Eubacterium sp.]|nr:GNAT family N-acetyltransferase [Eubacterium sp.]
KQILNNKNHHIIVCEIDNKIVSSCVCVIIPNLTHNQQPYAVIENVITDKAYRKKGYATQCLDYAKEIAKKENCYKMMLLTGSRKRSTHRFYQKAGYNKIEKTGYIQRI